MKDNVKTVSEVCSAGETGVSAATAGAETLKIRGSESLTTPVRQMGFNMIDLFMNILNISIHIHFSMK